MADHKIFIGMSQMTDDEQLTTCRNWNALTPTQRSQSITAKRNWNWTAAPLCSYLIENGSSMFEFIPAHSIHKLKLSSQKKALAGHRNMFTTTTWKTLQPVLEHIHTYTLAFLVAEHKQPFSNRQRCTDHIELAQFPIQFSEKEIVNLDI
jgi:hypothetical protein